MSKEPEARRRAGIQKSAKNLAIGELLIEVIAFKGDWNNGIHLRKSHRPLYKYTN